MLPGSSKLMRALAVAVLALVTLATATLAQVSDTETITVEVQGAAPFECVPVGTMTVDADQTDDEDTLVVPEGGTASNNPWVNFQLNVGNAGCDQWSVTATLDDFELSTNSSVTFPASSFMLTKTANGFENPQRWDADSQPDWVQTLPSDLDTGMPTMPDAVSFIESSPSGTASGDGPLFSASTAAYGTPGNSTAYYQMNVTNIPIDQTPGTYASTITVTAQGGD